MSFFFRFQQTGRVLLLGITLISLIKCLIFPNALDVLILVGLLILLATIIFGDGRSL
ncbi:MAG: hypothetical protein GX050_01850 [Firmicutes bacterium]|nr:hypothetical protein [Bacillota bacterium]